MHNINCICTCPRTFRTDMDYVIDVYDSSHNCRARCGHKQANDRRTPTKSVCDTVTDIYNDNCCYSGSGTRAASSSTATEAVPNVSIIPVRYINPVGGISVRARCVHHFCARRRAMKLVRGADVSIYKHFDACLDPDGAIAGGHLIRYVSATACSDRTDGSSVGNADRKHTGRKCRAKNSCMLSDYGSVYLSTSASSVEHIAYSTDTSYSLWKQCDLIMNGLTAEL